MSIPHLRRAFAMSGLLALALLILMAGATIAGAEGPAAALAPLRLAVEDMAGRFGPEWAHGETALAELADLERQAAELERAAADGAHEAQRQALMEQIDTFRRRALLSNPLLDFDRLLLIRRSVNQMGLSPNWESNSSLPKGGYDNALMTLSPVAPEGELSLFFQPEGGRFVGDVDLDFDAGRLLFSMPSEDGPWRLYELDGDGSNLRRVSAIEASDVDCYDGCYLPDGNLIFNATAPFTGVPCVTGASHVCNLYRLDRDTGRIRRLTVEQDHNWRPTVLNNGRVLYLRWEYTDIPHFVSRILFHMNPDGSGQMEYYGSNSYWPNSMFYARAIPDHPTRFITVVSGHHDTNRMGELILFDPALGRREADGVVQRIPGRGQAVEPLIRDDLVMASWPRFLHPWPLSGEYFLVACQPAADAEWGLYLADVFDNLTLIKEVPGHALLEPMPLRPRPRPPVIPSRVDPEADTALVYMMDVYEGPGLAGVPRGAVKALRVFTYHFAYYGMGGQFNRVGLDGPWDIKRVLGVVPVEEDGSALFTVPANTPISIQPLDEQGAALQLMRSWMTAMPGETLSCVGCHEAQNMGPAPRATLASRQTPSPIEPWYGPPRGFSFLREVQPVLDKHCVQCHSGAERDDGRDLPDFSRRPEAHPEGQADSYNQATRFPPSYLALRRYVRGHTMESDIHLLNPYEFHVSTTRLYRTLRRGHQGVALDGEAWDRLITWIDLNTPAHGTWREIVGDEKTLHWRDRRREMDRLYAGLDVDPEHIGPEADLGAPVLAPGAPTEAPAPTPECPGWPFDADTARARQTALEGDAVTLDLGDGVAIALVPIPAGAFIMGGPASDARPATVVPVDRPFWMSAHEITNRQYGQFDPAHDSRLEHGDFLQFDETERGYPLNGPDQPVARVSWREAMAFCDWLSQKSGRRITLPTEAQWEYACRAGADTDLWYGDLHDDFAAVANLADLSLHRVDTFGWGLPSGAIPPWRPAATAVDDGFRVSAPVGAYAPNPWGLYDMHGNVAEWTRSLYHPYPWNGDDGRNDREGEGPRVVRGGSWYDLPGESASGARLAYAPHKKVFNVGFRVLWDGEPPSGAVVIARRP